MELVKGSTTTTTTGGGGGGGGLVERKDGPRGSVVLEEGGGSKRSLEEEEHPVSGSSTGPGRKKKRKKTKRTATGGGGGGGGVAATAVGGGIKGSSSGEMADSLNPLLDGLDPTCTTIRSGTSREDTDLEEQQGFPKDESSIFGQTQGSKNVTWVQCDKCKKVGLKQSTNRTGSCVLTTLLSFQTH